MKRVITICLIFACLAGMAADKNHAELLCVWNFKTLYTTLNMPMSADVSRTEVQTYFFFSDNSFVSADIHTTYEEVLKLKSITSKRWMTVDNNLILLNEIGKQELGVVAKENQPVSNLLKGMKEIIQVVKLCGTVPQSYNDVLAFSPQ